MSRNTPDEKEIRKTILEQRRALREFRENILELERILGSDLNQ